MCTKLWAGGASGLGGPMELCSGACTHKCVELEEVLAMVTLRHLGRVPLVSPRGGSQRYA